jgi:hypothetical protein
VLARALEKTALITVAWRESDLMIVIFFCDSYEEEVHNLTGTGI